LNHPETGILNVSLQSGKQWFGGLFGLVQSLRKCHWVMVKLADNRQFIWNIIKQVQFLGSRLPTFEKTFTVFQAILRESRDAGRVLSSDFVSSPLIGYLEESLPETFLSELDRTQFFAMFLSKTLPISRGWC
jgi:hypothetical protein